MGIDISGELLDGTMDRTFSYTPKGGTARDVQGVFKRKDFIGIGVNDGSPSARRNAAGNYGELLVASADFSGDDYGGEVEVDGEVWRIYNHRIKGSGLTRIYLKTAGRRDA